MGIKGLTPISVFDDNHLAVAAVPAGTFSDDDGTARSRNHISASRRADINSSVWTVSALSSDAASRSHEVTRASWRSGNFAGLGCSFFLRCFFRRRFLAVGNENLLAGS